MSSKLKVILVSGPRGGGKSTLISLLAKHVCQTPPHYLRLVPVNDPEGPRLTLLGDLKTSGLISWRRINYTADRIYEFLPECLAEIARENSSPLVLIEADVNSNLRYAYPYDRRIFVMPAPQTVSEVFRTQTEAAQALREVMDDTAAFASEIFGLFDEDTNDDESPRYQRIRDRSGVTEERMEITPVQMRRFMNSPLGAEVASRIQLQPPFHSLMESDVILVNMAIGGKTEVVDLVIQQIQTLLNRLSEGRMCKPQLFNCDPLDFSDPLQHQLLKTIACSFEEK